MLACIPTNTSYMQHLFNWFSFCQPPGRPIQVETGNGERLPSIDTRPPRTRDADAIIEVILSSHYNYYELILGNLLSSCS